MYNPLWGHVYTPQVKDWGIQYSSDTCLDEFWHVCSDVHFLNPEGKLEWMQLATAALNAMAKNEKTRKLRHGGGTLFAYFLFTDMFFR